jgi:hypothetical protein
MSLREADRLLAGEPADRGRSVLGVLLAAAAAPPSAHELADRRAIDGFAAAYRAGRLHRQVGRRQRSHGAGVPPTIRRAAVKVAAGVAVLAVGGTAYAAESGYLPDAVQREAHHMLSPFGVPAPPVRPGDQPVPTPSPSATTPGAPAPAPSTVLGWCQAWDATRRDPRGKALPGDIRRALTAAAKGGEPAIAALCATVLGTPTTAATTPSAHPGNGRGNGRPHPSQIPHH